jgi:hypothetical protein
MIASIHMRGLGPHADTLATLAPSGVSEVTGATATGKSSMMDAVCFVFWGEDRHGKPFPVDAIRDSGPKSCVDVTLTTASGNVIRRTMRAKDRVQTRTLTPKDGAERTIKTEEEWRASLRRMGSDVKAIRLAMCPDGWVDLAHGELGGKALRDLLASLVPGVGLRAVVADLMADAGYELTDRDASVDQKVVDRLRAESTSRRDARVAAHDASARLVADLEASPPAAVIDVAPLVAIVAAARTWASYDVAHARSAEDLRARESAQARRAEWESRRAAIGERPALAADTTGALLAAARNEVQVAERELTRAQSLAASHTASIARAETAPDVELHDAARKLEALRRDVTAREAAGTTCPTCERPGWESAAAALEVARAAVRTAEAAHAALSSGAYVRLDTPIRPLRVAAVAAARDLDAAVARVAESRAASDAAQAAHDAGRGGREAVAAWDRALAALGAEPVVPSASSAATPPTVARPAPGDVAAAEQAIAANAQAVGAAREHTRTLAAARARLVVALADADAARTEAARMDALVAACRAAPSVLARQQLDSIGDVSPVSLDLTEAGGVEVLVDGRSWWRASTGRQIVADLAFRRGLRRLLKLPSLPLFVDEVQSVGGCDLVVEAPAILLRTTDGAFGVTS